MRERNGDGVGQRVEQLVEPDQLVAEAQLEAGDRLKLLRAFGASEEACGGPGRKPEAAAWTANVGHYRPFP